MTKHFLNELDTLKSNTLSLGAQVEEAVFYATKSFLSLDTKMAESVLSRDLEIDRMEVNLEEECLKLLALYQPVAQDLRFVVAALKLNSDLERIGDLAANIALRALLLFKAPRVSLKLDLQQMADIAKTMLRQSLDALLNTNSSLAREVLKSDDQVDALNRQTHTMIVDAMKKDPQSVEAYICYLGVSRSLERIADHATNIAEDVIYLVDGEIVRHGFRPLQ